MYAQLCRKLSEETPNYDPSDGPCTFNRLLIGKCQDEFERRRQATEIWENTAVPLKPEEEELRFIARKKMVGNLRFIGVLGKLEIIHESILHKCIQQLLEKKQRSMADLAQDLECLCQIMKTCGKVLDKPKAKNLMDQYFERKYQLSINMELQPRIRFMLQDMLELRKSYWVPRKVAVTEGPKTIQQVREEAARDLGVYIPPPNVGGSNRPSGPLSPLSGMPAFLYQGMQTRTGMDDVFGHPMGGEVTLGTGPGVISSQPDKFSYESNGYGQNNSRDQGGFRNMKPQGPNYQQYQSKHFNNNQNYNQRNNQNNQQSNTYNNIASKELPPRFMKMFTQGRQSSGPNQDEVSLRPSSSIVLKPKFTSGFSSSNQERSNSYNDYNSGGVSLAQPPNQKPTPPLRHKEQPILIKQASSDKQKNNKKDKGPSREEYLKRLTDVIETLLKEGSVDQSTGSYKALKIPERFSSVAFCKMLTMIASGEEKSIEVGFQFVKKLITESITNADKLNDGLKQLIDQCEESTSLLEGTAILSTLFIKDSLIGFGEFADLLESVSDQHFNLIILVLQKLHKEHGKSDLQTIFNESKVNLLNYLPEAKRTKEVLCEYLEKSELTFLLPLLRIQSDLWTAINNDPLPLNFYKYIKDNLAVEYHTDNSFINALLTVIIKYVVHESTFPIGTNPCDQPDKASTENENELLKKYKPVLDAFLHDRSACQVAAIYTLQVFTYSSGFPKGMLLRWFVSLYDLEIIEEEAFLNWKEDLSQEYPGKGKALFQVNQWLTWLQETEESGEDDDGEN